MESKIADILFHVLRALRYILKKSMSKRKLLLELQLFLHRGKLAGKAIANLLQLQSLYHHHNYNNSSSNGFTTFSLDPKFSFYFPNDIEFSCSSTPSYTLPYGNRSSSHKKRNGRRLFGNNSRGFDRAATAEAFEVFSLENSDVESVSASPLVLPATIRKVRSVRVTDSPFPIIEEEERGVGSGRVDREAEEFIKRFYEQLQRQDC